MEKGDLKADTRKSREIEAPPCVGLFIASDTGTGIMGRRLYPERFRIVFFAFVFEI